MWAPKAGDPLCGGVPLTGLRPGSQSHLLEPPAPVACGLGPPSHPNSSVGRAPFCLCAGIAAISLFPSLPPIHLISVYG